MLTTLHDDDARYVETYWSRLGPSTYVVGDAARRDADGYIRILGRIDDVINVSGHRLSTAEVEAAIDSHEDVAEAAVVAQDDELTGQAIVAFVTLRQGRTGTPEIAADITARIAEGIGKLARPREIVWAEDLPKTRSGKIMRRLLADLANERPVGDTTTLGGPGTVERLQKQPEDPRAERP
jgi:acetyl-CoA synthetase